ncbi:MAG: hypothetical protein QOH21_2517 [Acidobacteriota bacterium]|jgi:hypothetical protein|nr:hypothetical protein [Acidobacteriota bacterium]
MATAIAGIAVWLAANWVLAVGHVLTRGSLVLVLGFLGFLGFLGVPRLRQTVSEELRGTPRNPRNWFTLLLLWTAFILWRGAVVPPVSHDAMTYHLPRAAMFVQAGGFERFASPDARITTFPANYELLLADVFLLTGSDALTEWIGTAFYLLFLGVTAMVARRWWGPGLHVTAAVLVAGGAPLLLLHSGADKNDVMAAVLAIGALFWSARWCAEGGRAAAMLAIVCAAMAVGTKMTAGAVLLAIVPFGIAALLRRKPRPRDIAASALFTALAFLLLGGWVFVQNVLAPAAQASSVTAGVPTAAYGDWRNLWELPYALVRVSLGFHAPWPWPKHDLFFSHYGALFGLAMLALPFCVIRYRRAGSRERTIGSLAALLGFAILLPIVQLPRLATGAIARYGVFVLPFVLAWTIVPVVRELELRFPRYARAALAVIAIVFVLEAVDIARNDTFVPLEYARWAAAHPGTRETVYARTRATLAVDRLAAANDTVAVFGGSDVWLYPAYGRQWTRRVIHLPYNANSARAAIPDAARWVVVDQAPATLLHPTPAELAFFDGMRRDGRFTLAWRNATFNQAVFQRTATRVAQ